MENREARRYFDECTKRFGINYDTEFDTTEEKDNFEEISKVVDEVFEEVKGMVQDNWARSLNEVCEVGEVDEVYNVNEVDEVDEVREVNVVDKNDETMKDTVLNTFTE